MAVKIKGVKNAQAGIARIMRAAEKTSPMLRMLGRKLRDDARLRITTQDGGQYEPLSKWTRARTGRRKALITERKHISFRLVGGKTLIVGHTPVKGDWSLAQHEDGFTTPGLGPGRTIGIPMKMIRSFKSIE